MPTPPQLTPSERDRYEKDGFFYRLDVFSADELVALRDAAERVHARVVAAADAGAGGEIEQIDNQKFQPVLGSTIKWEWKDELRAVRSMEPTHHLDPRLSQLVDDPRLWQPCADLIGRSDLSLFSDKLNVKRPGGAPFPWHQEGPYWVYGAEDLANVVTLILYLDDATEENGCLWVIPGTHRYGTLDRLEDRGTLGRLYTDVSRLEQQPFAAALPAGSVLWFHRDLVHGSQSNHTDQNRRAFLLAYQPAGLRQWRSGERRDIAATRAS